MHYAYQSKVYIKQICTFTDIATTMKLLIAVSLCVVLTAQSFSSPLGNPPFCRDYDCPKLSVVDRKKDYEVRKYEPSKWVGTLVPSMNWTSALDEGYSRLYKYRNKGNKENILLPMASPVATKIEPGQGPACASNFTVVEKKDGYEKRTYESSRWVGTTISSDDYLKSVDEGFDRLFKYISGDNRNATKVPMATPVATKIVPGKNGNSNTFTVLFFTPFAYKTGTPVPTNPQLAIVDLPSLTAHVKSFAGYEKDSELKEYATKLEDNLKRDGAKYVEDFYFTVGYDPPYRFIGRHNEVWFAAD